MSLVRKEESFPWSELQGSAERPAKLFDLFSKGDLRARDVFYDATKGLLFAILLHILNRTEIAEAVLPELYSELKRKARHLNKQRDHPLTWLVLIVHQNGVERLCRELDIHATRRRTGKGKDLVTDEPFINITEQRRVIRASMKLLPRSERRMLELAFFSGLNTVEIAAELGLSTASVDHGLLEATRQVFCVVKCLRFSRSDINRQSATEVFFQP